MKIMILTVTAGYGHHATANAIADAMRCKNAEVQVVDVLEHINKLLQEFVARGYLITARYMREAYRIVYRFLEEKNQSTSKYSIANLVNALLAFKFENFIYDFNPDAIVCTHVTAAQIINELKRRNKLPAPTIGIVTDYTIHPFWEDVTDIEYIVVASDLLVHRAELKGIQPDHIKPLGIPIHPKFAKKRSQSDARSELGLSCDSPCLLVMGGSMGYGNIARLVEHIHTVNPALQILAVCGNNKAQYQQLLEMGHIPQLHPFGFVDTIDLMMDAADCILTKPGGLTVTEALAKDLPMILVNPIPGHEERNVEFLLNNGMALLITKTFPVSEALYYLFHNPRRLELMQACIHLYSKPNATNDISNFVLSLCEPKSNS